MACLHPIAIKNRKYYRQPEDVCASNLWLQPEDVFRQTLLVPCGHCAECLRAERNAWYVRLNREYECQRTLGNEVWFVTLTIAPRFYRQALDSPSKFIRRFFETIRHVYGKSIKHAFFTEFSPTKGRMHFHGILFGPDIRFRDLHSIALGFGWIWAQRVRSVAACRYVVKYITKDIGSLKKTKTGRQFFDPAQLFDDRKYRRKFISAHVGDYIGRLPKPCFDVQSWNFTDPSSGVTYSYRIPRYYDKYIGEEDRRKKAIAGAFLAAQVSGDVFASDTLLSIATELFGADFAGTFSSPEFLSSVWRASKQAFLSPPRSPSGGDSSSGIFINTSF